MPPLTDVVKKVRPGQTGFFTSPSLHCMVVVSSCCATPGPRVPLHRDLDRLDRGLRQLRQEVVIPAISTLQGVSCCRRMKPPGSSEMQQSGHWGWADADR